MTKDPSNYSDSKSQPHVTVALRMKSKGLNASSGDTIPYIICTKSIQEGSSSQADFAYHPDEVKKDTGLKIDNNWYLQTQIHPPISRLCEHIEGTDSGQIASCLGLDPRKFNTQNSVYGADNGLISLNNCNSVFLTLQSDEERFSSLEKLKLTCCFCQHQFEFTGLLKGKRI